MGKRFYAVISFLMMVLILDVKRQLTEDSGRSKSMGNSQKQEIFFIFKQIEMGRLGNFLFQYASTMGIANYTNRVAIFGKELIPLMRIFPKMKLNTQEHFSPVWPPVKENSAWNLDEKLFNLEKSNITLKGFLLSFRYFENISTWLYKDILSHMNEALVSKAEHFVREGKKQYELDNEWVYSNYGLCTCQKRGQGHRAHV